MNTLFYNISTPIISGVPQLFFMTSLFPERAGGGGGAGLVRTY